MDKNGIVEKIKNSGKKLKDFRPERAGLTSYFESLQANGKTLVATVIAAVFVMLFFACVIFFLHVKGPEEVMVPEVRGKELTDALLEMQK